MYLTVSLIDTMQIKNITKRYHHTAIEASATLKIAADPLFKLLS